MFITFDLFQLSLSYSYNINRSRWDLVGRYFAGFKKKKYLVIVITNQPEINNGKLSLKEFKLMNEKIFNFLNIDDLYFCPHKKIENCKCRKPNVGLFKKAISKHKINCAIPPRLTAHRLFKLVARFRTEQKPFPHHLPAR